MNIILIFERFFFSFQDMDTLKSQFTGKGALNNEQMQKLLKLLHEVLRECKRSEDASQVMIELLGTYTTENASQAREETHRYEALR